MTGRADPLAVLRRASDWWTDGSVASMEMLDAIAEVAALVEADRKYDRARAAVGSLRDGVSTIGEVLDAEHWLAEAQKQRAAALSAFGESP